MVDEEREKRNRPNEGGEKERRERDAGDDEGGDGVCVCG
jgi:hypothetical protein